MPQSIPPGLQRDHVLRAFKDLDAGVEHAFGPPTKFEVVHDGKRYAPKAVIGLSMRHLTGELLGPEDFSGGTSKGQANLVLRDLGFEMVRKQGESGESFITSRRDPLPKDAQQMGKELWYNLWSSRQWPYRELFEGDTLYWFDQVENAVVWQSRVRKVDCFKYPSKDFVMTRLRDVFGVDDISHWYFDDAKDEGYCLAYQVEPLARLHVPRPEGFNFPMYGWVRVDDEPNWQHAFAGMNSSGEISKSSKSVVDSGYFVPGTMKDEREKVLREIVRRRGQPEFRDALIDAYGGRCAVTGCDAVAALEAAHIVPYTGAKSQHVANGLLLRADIHTLFDLDLIGIVPKSLTIAVAPAIKTTVYGKLDGKKLEVPANAATVPNRDALAERWKRFAGGQS